MGEQACQPVAAGFSYSPSSMVNALYLQPASPLARTHGHETTTLSTYWSCWPAEERTEPVMGEALSQRRLADADGTRVPPAVHDRLRSLLTWVPALAVAALLVSLWLCFGVPAGAIAR